jgi:serine/threonine protein kinase/formylglycine-generating enzyme required for sulfatase activity
MPLTTPCPGLEDCQRLLHGLLPSRQVTTLTEHIAQCERCQETVRQLSADDSLQEALPGAGAADLPRGEVVEGLIRQVCRLRPGVAPDHTPPPAADTAESYPFLALPQGPDEIGRLGAYRVLKVLGHGGMGIVFQAEDVQLRRLVALKVMKPALADNAVNRQRFLREAQAAAAVRHDHVVTIYQVDQDRDVPFLAMELLAGETLEARLQREERLPPAEVMRIGREIATGLAAAHERGLIHRDIKPSNIWLEGERGRVKILDFGLVRAAGDEPRLTATGAIAGTPEYMAPEQARGEPLDHRADLFSLGCVLYRLAVGEAPFRGKEPLAVLQALAVEQPQSPRRRNPATPRPLSALIMRLIAKSRDERPATAQAVVQALEAIQPPPAMKAPAPSKPRRVWRRRAVLSAAALLLAGLGLAGYWFYPTLVTLVHASAQPGPGSVAEPREPPGGRPGSSNEKPAPDGPEPAPPPKPDPAPRPEPPQVSPEELAHKAEAILRANCYRCHGRDGTIEGGFNYVLDRERLVARHKIVSGNPDRSKLYQRVASKDDPMPPVDAKQRPSPEDILLVRAWIKAGAPDFRARPAERELVSETTILESIKRDIDGQDPADRRLVRYLTITHLYNAGLGEDELQTYRHGLAKLINSLSWGPRIVVPQPIDESRRTVFRINLGDYKWTRQEWDRILAAYPYGVMYDTPAAQSCYAATRCRVPFVRADWFVFAASRPPLYHDLLKLPKTAVELEESLKIDGTEAIRAGFDDSGVAQHHRLIERRDALHGAYWKTYDFAGAGGRQNFFKHPLGPGPEENQFEHAGSEIIFNLPNDLQGYLLVDAKGNRIDKGPEAIVKDQMRPDGRVENGISCMSCHVLGVIDKTDRVWAHVQRSLAMLKPQEARLIRALYGHGSKLTARFREDRKRFAHALEELGAPSASMDPVVALASLYEWKVDLGLAAAEAGVRPDDLRAALARPPLQAGAFARLRDDGGTVERPVLEQDFADLVGALHRGTFYQPVRGEPLVNSIGMQLRLVPAGTVRMGSPPLEDGHTEPEEEQHEVVIPRPFYIGVYEVTQKEYREVMGRNPSHFSADGPGRDVVKGMDTDCFPVDSVSWEDAQEFCKELSRRQKEKTHSRVYRLPTEAEWEYACRGGDPAANPFHVGRSISSDQANFDGGQPYGDEAVKGPNLGRTTKVGSYPEPNGFGLYDMHGNVAEWCDGRPVAGVELRVLRGGSWLHDARNCRSAARVASLPKIKNKAYGFRVVCTIADKTP